MLKSMLLAVTAETTDRWSFSEEVTADVAICEPTSTLASVTLSRADRAGRPACVWLATDGVPVPTGRRLEDPIGTASLIAMLDAVSGELMVDRPAASAPSAGPGQQSPPAPVSLRFDALLIVRDLLDQGRHDTSRVDMGDLVLDVHPQARTVHLSERLTDGVMARLLHPAREPRLQPVPDGGSVGPAHAMSADLLLWRAGLAGGAEALLPTLPGDGAFTLTRWPDFGRLGHDPRFLRMASRLSRRSQTIEELARTTNLPAADARAFVTACALSGLIEVRLEHATGRPAHEADRSRPQFGGVLKSIRLALGLGGR